MKPHARSIFDLFDGKRRYEVPLFQRQYVWNEDDHWAPLWEDIERKYRQRLENRERTPHFLGAMVLDERRVFGNAVPSQLVIDGQQRLTTFQIFLAAFRDVCSAHDQMTYAAECRRYLLNDGIMQEPEVEKFKLWPTHSDRDPFVDVITSESRDELEKRHPVVRQKYARKDDARPRVVECYLYFSDQLTKLLAEDGAGTPVGKIVSSLHEAMQRSLQIVTIELETDDDPQVIFETLNARGEPLLPSDLLRNYIFLRAKQNEESTESLYKRFWLPFDDGFWRSEEKQGRYLRPRSDIFLQHYLTMRTQNDVVISHLYAEYKDWIKTKDPYPTVEAELVDLAKYRNLFRGISDADGRTPLGHFAQFLRRFEVSPIMPLLLGILGSDPDDDTLGEMLRPLESFIVRRAACGLTTKNYNRMFLVGLNRCVESGYSPATIKSFLRRQEGPSVYWPRDEEFKKALVERSLMQAMSGNRVAWILEGIEEELRHPHSEKIDVHSEVTVEHVMPQQWVSHWRLSDGREGVIGRDRMNLEHSEDLIGACERRDEMLGTLGNLTLLTRSMNSSVSNAPYVKKRQELAKNSALAMNRYFNEIPDWSEDEILRRSAELAKLAALRWTGPESG